MKQMTVSLQRKVRKNGELEEEMSVSWMGRGLAWPLASFQVVYYISGLLHPSHIRVEVLQPRHCDMLRDSLHS